MKQNLIISLFAAALLCSGVANAAGTLYPKDYTDGVIALGEKWYKYDTLVVDTPLTLTGPSGYLDLYNGGTIEFQKEQAAAAICSIRTSAELGNNFRTVFFNEDGDVYNFTFDAGAQAIVAASAGTPITLIEDLSMASLGFSLADSTTLKLNGAEAGNPVKLGGVEFTYVGPQSSDYTFLKGEIGFTGYEDGSHALNLVVGNATPTPEPTTGTLSLLALAGLCARRRRK